MNAWVIFFIVLVLIVFFTALYAVLTVFKGCLVKIRYKSIDGKQCEQMRGHKGIAELMDKADNVEWTLSFCLLGVTLGLGALVLYFIERVAIIFQMREDFFWMLGLSIFLILYVLLCIRFLVLKRGVGCGNPEKTLQLVLGTVLVLSKLLFPLIWFMKFLIRVILWLCRVDAGDTFYDFDDFVQIRALTYEHKSLPNKILRIVRNTIRLPELVVSDVILPRNQIQYLDLNDNVLENLDKAKHLGHTRFPICKGDMDHCIGILHIKDIFQYQGDMETLDLSKFKRQIIQFPENTPLEDVLKKLLKFKIHMALVVDAFGGTLGVVTMEHILEELVGTIQDEFDMEEEPIVLLAENVYRVSGLATIHELESTLGVAIENEEVSTFGGLITTELGRIPEKDERLLVSGLKVKIEEVSDKRVICATVRLS